MKLRFGFLLLAIGLSGFLLSDPAQAQKGKKDLTPEEIADLKGKSISELVTAYKLIEIGRREKAPEALVTAGGILLRMAKVPMDSVQEKPTIKVGKDSKEEPLDKVLPAPDYEKEGNQLLDEARFMASKAKLDLEPLIKLVKDRGGELSPVGGPKQVSRMIGAYQNLTFHFKLARNQGTHFGFRSSAPMRVTVVQSQSDSVWGDMYGAVGQAVWFPPGHIHPPKKGGKKAVDPPVPITIHVINAHSSPQQFHFWLN